MSFPSLHRPWQVVGWLTRSTSREALNHLHCIAFLSPSHDSIEAVKSELSKPRYGGYWLCAWSAPSGEMLTADFSNVLTKAQIEEMATVDEFEVVKEVQVGWHVYERLHVGILRGLPRPVQLARQPHTVGVC